MYIFIYPIKSLTSEEADFLLQYFSENRGGIIEIEDDSLDKAVEEAKKDNRDPVQDIRAHFRQDVLG